MTADEATAMDVAAAATPAATTAVPTTSRRSQLLDQATRAALSKVFTGYWTPEKFRACYPSLNEQDARALWERCRTDVEQAAMSHYERTLADFNVRSKLAQLDASSSSSSTGQPLPVLDLSTASNPPSCDPHAIARSIQQPVCAAECASLEEALHALVEEQRVMARALEEKLAVVDEERRMVGEIMERFPATVLRSALAENAPALKSQLMG